MNCFKELTNGSVCENCGYDNDKPTDTMYLQPKTVLEDRYVIGAVDVHESDAVVYRGYDSQLDAVINIREFLPKGIANRLEGNLDVHVRERYKSSYEKYKESFLNLWSTIIKMRNLSSVIPTYDVFEANGTAYAISEHMESITLRNFCLGIPTAISCGIRQGLCSCRCSPRLKRFILIQLFTELYAPIILCFAVTAR